MAVQQIEDLKPIYLIYGKEQLLLERALRRLKDRVGAVADLDFNFDTFEGESVDAATVVAAANTLPFASERRLVVVLNVDRMSKAQQEALAAYAEDPAPSACVVLVAESVPKNSRLYKAVEAHGVVAEYKAPKRAEYPAWVTELFASRGRTISAEGARALVTAVGHDLRRLEIEAEKVIAFAGERTTLGAEDVEAVVSATAPASVFELLDALGARQCGPALEVLDDLVASGESILGIHALAVRHIRSLVGTRALLDRGESLAAVQREFGLPDWRARKLLEQARRFTADELARALRSAADVERAMKSGEDERVVFETWLAEVCRQAP